MPETVLDEFGQNGNSSDSSLYKTRFCRNLSGPTGVCQFGQRCHFAHSVGELRAHKTHPLYKTELCLSYHTKGRCIYAEHCRYIHKFSEAAVVNWRRWREQLEEARQLATAKSKFVSPMVYQAVSVIHIGVSNAQWLASLSGTDTAADTALVSAAH